MPLTWQWPPPNTTFGPGSFFTLTQTDIGPIPLDDTIEIQIRDDQELIRFIWLRFLAQGRNTWRGIWGQAPFSLSNQGFEWFIEERLPAKEGEQLHLLAVQQHADGTQVGSISLPITYSPTVTSWFPNILPQQTVTIPPATDDQLDRIESAVYQVFPHA